MGIERRFAGGGFDNLLTAHVPSASFCICVLLGSGYRTIESD
nr:MAG TPA: hypothetical protein [Caudoviricetes sp.]